MRASGDGSASCPFDVVVPAAERDPDPDLKTWLVAGYTLGRPAIGQPQRVGQDSVAGPVGVQRHGEFQALFGEACQQPVDLFADLQCPRLLPSGSADGPDPSTRPLVGTGVTSPLRRRDSSSAFSQQGAGRAKRFLANV